MTDVRFPLAGDVSQVINPWTWVSRWAENQFGLININLGKSSDPDVEQQVLNEVGSYGKQLGRIGDALGVLINHFNKGNLSEKEMAALILLKEQLRDIDRIKGISKTSGAPK